MRIGIPTETRAGEKRVAATPETVKKLAGSGQHQIVVQSGAGAGAFFPDSEYTSAGASIVPSASEIYQQSDIVLKVRGPEDGELGPCDDEDEDEEDDDDDEDEEDEDELPVTP